MDRKGGEVLIEIVLNQCVVTKDDVELRFICEIDHLVQSLIYNTSSESSNHETLGSNLLQK